eukprot:CAMPEP_0171292010 /NCGR_PEP_ID=MMETSP0790-20130122/71941_1 /TAXON_ID=2925 /ORGANISM="Alexandrium catenella, Strain OF101" /LENGTH=1257 /DNA_ID=CAMNT_0011761739 /DNA_START=74 /DNA_END=3848 /DNA_ORIENTATION=-
MADEAVFERKFITRLVKIHGVEGTVVPRIVADGDSSQPVEVNGLKGRAVDWRMDTGKYVVCTFDFVHLDIAEENLEIFEPPLPADGGFDIGWPYYQAALLEFCSNVNNILLSKSYALIQVFKSQDAREEALARAKRKDFEVPKEEFITDFLGRKGRGKVSHFNPLDTMDEEEARLAGEPKNDLERYDMDITSMFALMGPMTWDSFGFHSHSRTDSMCWVPFGSTREEHALVPEPLNDEEIDEDLVVERHIQFIRRRKLTFLYMVDNEGGTLTLHPRSDLKMESVTIPVEKNRLLVFRSDLMAFEFKPEGQHLTLQSWFLEPPPKITLGDIVANSENYTEALNIQVGPLFPQGQRAHIMAAAAFGGTWNLEEAGNMYMAATDAHTYVPNTRFDTDIYFTKNGDVDLIPFQNAYHHHGGLCYDADVMSFDHSFFGYTGFEASLLQPAQHKTLEVGYETLFRAGYTKKTVNGQPILIYVGDCGCEWWNNTLVKQMNGLHLQSSEGRMQFEEGKRLDVTGQRLSYTLGMRGPAWVCDTACSSGLTAFCTAMFSIKKPTIRGTESPSIDPHCVGALAGGTNMIVDAGVYIGASGQHMLSLKGRCFTFDMGGDGYARGEGTSMCYVTISDNDRDTEMQEGMAIGNKVNQDGRSASMTAPNGPSQQMCIKASLREAGVMPHDITASECHGTGTSLGDPIEVGSLRGVQETDDRDGPIFLTSSKSNIGHLEANAGTTGLFKCILMSKYGCGLPNCHMRTLNPHLDISGWPTYMISEAGTYNQQSGLVGVSSFGVSGTNSHAEVWGFCRVGPNVAGRRKLNMDAIKQITVTCPITLAPIDHLTGEPASNDGRKIKADCLRDELQPYDVSTLAYEGGFRYRREEIEDSEELVNPPGVQVTIMGSWSGFRSWENMEEEEDGPYQFTVALGETRCETFVIAINGIPDYKFWPMCNKAGKNVWVEGPDPNQHSANKRWMIDGRDEQVPTGTLYRIKFFWGQRRKQVTWEEVSPDSIPKPPRYSHRYQVLGTWSSGRMDDLVCKDGVWTYSGKIGVSGQEEFQLARDADDMQLIYPARPQTTATNVAVRGPDDLGKGKMWQVTGAVGELVKLRLEVNDGQVIVSVTTKSQGEKVWESQEGWERHSYWLTFIGGPAQQMTMDPELPGVFRARGTIGQNYYEKYRGLCEFFNITIDEDANFGYFPDVAYAGSNECICWGPDRVPTATPFMVKSLQAGAGFEVVLDTRAADRRKRVTWVWDTPPQFNFAAMLMN